ncbi:DUF2997 domain-containing protein [bacterium]|nr:DUF2997 domain-containing protein [bacterium]
MSENVQEIEFTIKKDGSVEYTIKGIKGGSCEDLSKIFEELGTMTASKKTSEYFEKEPKTKVITQRK